MNDLTGHKPDHLEGGILARLARWALVWWAVLLAAALPFGRHASLAVALGGAISLGSFQCFCVLVPAWVRSRRRRLARMGLPAVSLVKWPLLWLVLSWAVRREALSPEWLCFGLGLVPAAVTAFAISAVAAERRRLERAAEGKP